MPRPLTQLQKEVFEFVKSHIEVNDYAPTMREIQESTSVNNIGLVHKNLSALDKKGYIEKQENTNRGISLTNKGESIEIDDIPMKVQRDKNQEELFEETS